MPLSPEMERLKKAAGSEATEEAGVLADAAAELEATATLAGAHRAFAREAGIDPAALIERPVETAQAFGRELADLKAARSALPVPPNAETVSDRRRELTREVNRLNTEKGFPKSFTDGLLNVLAGTAERPNAVMLGRDDGAESFRGLAIVELLSKLGPVPPTGSFAAGREAPRQTPASGQQTPEQLREEGRQAAEKSQREQLERMGHTVK